MPVIKLHTPRKMRLSQFYVDASGLIGAANALQAAKKKFTDLSSTALDRNRHDLTRKSVALMADIPVTTSYRKKIST